MIPASAPKWAIYAGLAAGAALLIYFVRRGVSGVASDVAGAAVGAAKGAVEGTVLGIGDAVGVPRTNAAACQFAKEGGNWKGVADYCEAGDAFRWGLSQTWEGTKGLIK